MPEMAADAINEKRNIWSSDTSWKPYFVKFDW